MEPLFDDGYRNVYRNSNPNLGLDGIVGGPEKGLDPQYCFIQLINIPTYHRDL